MKESRADGLAGVRGDDRAAAVLVSEEMMAAFDANDPEAGLRKRGNEGRTGDTGEPAQAAMVTR